MSQFNYPKTEVGNLLRNGFANRKRSETLAGDKKLASNDPMDSYKALSDGNYKGLEGIQYGTAGGLPAAMMPDGHVVLISEGEMIAGVQQREKRRRQMVETMAGDMDRREFGKKYQANFDNALASTELDESTAGLLRARYEADPGSAITFLTNYKIDDQREVARMKRDLEVEEKARIDQVRSSRAQGFAQILKNTTTGTPKEVALRQNAGVLALSHAATMQGSGADATAFYLQNDNALTEMAGLASSMSYGSVRKAQEAFNSFGGNVEEFAKTEAFLNLQRTIQETGAQLGIGFDASKVALGVVMRDGQSPDVMNSPLMQQMVADVTRSQITGLNDPGPSPEIVGFEKDLKAGASVDRAALRDATIKDQKGRLITIADQFTLLRPGTTVPPVQALLEAVANNDPVATRAVSQIMGPNAMAQSLAIQILSSVTGGELTDEVLDAGLRESQTSKKLLIQNDRVESKGRVVGTVRTTSGSGSVPRFGPGSGPQE